MSAPSRRTHILLIDDSRLWLAMLRVYLAPFDVHVHEAQSGAWALQVLTTVVPDAVIVDYNLGWEMDGEQLVRTIRSHHNQAVAALPVMMFSGDERARMKALDAGVNTFITKPIDHHSFVSALEHLLPRLRESTLLGVRTA